MKTLVPPDDGRSIENVKTQPGAAGPNPTISSLLQFKVPLPVEKLYQPKLLVTVHDYVFSGFSQPLLGSFTIPLGELVDRLKEERERETLAIINIIQELMKIDVGLGIKSYTIQRETAVSINVYHSGSSSHSKKEEVKSARSSMKIDDEMKQPLLMDENDQYDEEEEMNFDKVPNFAPRATTKFIAKPEVD